jgi:hypothetical protein
MNTLKRFVDNFRFSSSKTPTQSVFEGISTIENLLNDIDGSLVSDDANYQEQKSLISQIENITKKLISERKGLVVEKNKLTVQIAEAKNERETKLVSAVEKQEYDKIINGLKGTLKEIVRRIGVIDSTLKLQKPSGITTRLQNLLKLNKSIEPNNQSQLQRSKQGFDENVGFQTQLNTPPPPTVVNTSDNKQPNYIDYSSEPTNEINEDEFKETTEGPDNKNDTEFEDFRMGMKGGYRYPTSSASRKNKYKKSSRNASVTRGGKRKHTRKHNKKGGNKRKHGRKSHKARK